MSSYELTGSFKQTAERSSLPWSRSYVSREAFDSFDGNNAKTGTFRTAVFEAPVELHFFVSGFPSLPGMRIYLLNEQQNATIELTNRIDPGFGWKMHFWVLPKVWQRTPIRLVVEDNGTTPNSWIGITLPKRGGQSILFSLQRALVRNGLVIVFGLMFLFPGVAGCALLHRAGFAFDFKRAACAVLVISSSCAYSLFGLYLLRPAAGRAGSILLFGISCALVIILRRNIFPEWKTRFELLACLTAVLLTATFYCSLGYLYTTDDGPGDIAQFRYRSSMPPDNMLPNIFAERLYTGASILPSLIGYWHSSDRPPLQTAITLMEKPFFPPAIEALTYQSLGIFLQCTWVAGIWVLLRSAGLKMRHVAFASASCLFSYFCLIHSFYVWPKLLSATFCLMGLSFFPFGSKSNDKIRNNWPLFDGALAAAAFALGMLCHPGIVFTFTGIFALAAIQRRVPPLKTTVAGILCAAILLLPWTAYQRFYDPPGDNLLKAHLAGVIDFQHSLFSCIVTAYKDLTLRRWVVNKLKNVQVLFAGDELFSRASWNPDHFRKTLVESSFFYLLFSAGVLNFAFLTRYFSRVNQNKMRFADQLLLIAAISLVAWCMVMFDSGSTLVHQGSFATVLLLMVGLSVWLLESAPKLSIVLLAVQALLLFPMFVFSWPVYQRPGTIGDAPIDSVMALFAGLSLGTLSWLYLWLLRREPESALDLIPVSSAALLRTPNQDS